MSVSDSAHVARGTFAGIGRGTVLKGVIPGNLLFPATRLHRPSAPAQLLLLAPGDPLVDALFQHRQRQRAVVDQRIVKPPKVEALAELGARFRA
jgi:hypothetical protein